MIFQRLGPDDLGAEAAQRGEEFPGIADPGKGKTAQAGPVHAGAQRLQPPAQMRQATDLAAPCPDKALPCRRRPYRQQEVGARQTRGHRFAQRPGGQAPPIAEPAHGIDHHDGDIVGHRGVLKPVIHDDHLRPATSGEARGAGAVAADEGRREGGDQQRLVADIGGAMRRRVALHRSSQAPAMAARDDRRPPPAVLQPLNERDHRRRLAGAARVEIADTDHRHGWVIRRRPRHPPRRRPRVERPQRGQKTRPRTRVLR